MSRNVSVIPLACQVNLLSSFVVLFFAPIKSGAILHEDMQVWEQIQRIEMRKGELGNVDF